MFVEVQRKMEEKQDLLEAWHCQFPTQNCALSYKILFMKDPFCLLPCKMFLLIFSVRIFTIKYTAMRKKRCLKSCYCLKLSLNFFFQRNCLYCIKNETPLFALKFVFNIYIVLGFFFFNLLL